MAKKVIKAKTKGPVFTSDELKIVRSGILTVWNGIGHDIMGIDEEEEPSGITNEGAVEGCIDADRLTQYKCTEADNLVKVAIEKHGYDETLTAISNEVALV